MSLPLGTRVDVIAPAHGLGTIMHVMGGPDGPIYRVLLDQPTDHGIPCDISVRESDLILAPPIPNLSIGDRVTYLGRSAIVTDAAPDGTVYILCDPDPPELWSDTEHERHFVLKPWQIQIQPR